MSEPLTDEQLREMRARCDAATPGPWSPGDGTAESCFHGSYAAIAHGAVILEGNINFPKAALSDIAFCCAARTVLPAALDEIDAIHAALGLVTPREEWGPEGAVGVIDTMRKALGEQAAEIERLRAMYEAANTRQHRLREERDRLAEEVERLIRNWPQPTMNVVQTEDLSALERTRAELAEERARLDVSRGGRWSPQFPGSAIPVEESNA